jgi:organic hydroperoxide reductase OsmC/OhrA
LAWEAGREGLATAPPRPPIAAGPPPEFDGRNDVWSPEHLLLSALNLCQMTTFLALAARARLEVVSYRSSASGVLDKTAEGLRFTAIRLRIDLAVPGADVERGRQLLHTAHRHCIVSNSLNVAVEIEAIVEAATGQGASAEGAATVAGHGNPSRGSVAP